MIAVSRQLVGSNTGSGRWKKNAFDRRHEQWQHFGNPQLMTVGNTKRAMEPQQPATARWVRLEQRGQQWQSPIWGTQHQQQQGPHRLRDPAQDLRMVQRDLRRILFEEYAETRELDTILEWAKQIRENGINATPLMDLIDRLCYAPLQNKSLIPPLYLAFLRSTEPIPYMDRIELLFPVILHAFKSDDVLASVESLSQQINKYLSQYNSPDRTGALHNHIKLHFSQFMLLNEKREKIIVRVAESLRRSGIYATPSVDFVELRKVQAEASRKNQPINLSYHRNIALKAYKAFMEDENERKLFKDRSHIYFPWMLQQLREKNSFNRATVVLRLIQLHSSHPADVPNFMLDSLRSALPSVFYYFCDKRDFRAADFIWEFGSNMQSNPFDANVIKRNLNPICIQLFALHLWTCRKKMTARSLLRSRFLRQTLNQNDKDSTKLNEMLREINDLNVCYRQIVLETPVSDQTRDQCHQIFTKAIRDKIDTKAWEVKKYIVKMLEILYNDVRMKEERDSEETTNLDRVNEVLNCIEGIARRPDVRKEYLEQVLKGQRRNNGVRTNRTKEDSDEGRRTDRQYGEMEEEKKMEVEMV